MSQVEKATPRPVGTPAWVHRADEAAVLDQRMRATLAWVPVLLILGVAGAVAGFCVGYRLFRAQGT